MVVVDGTSPLFYCLVTTLNVAAAAATGLALDSIHQKHADLMPQLIMVAVSACCLGMFIANLALDKQEIYRWFETFCRAKPAAKPAANPGAKPEAKPAAKTSASPVKQSAKP